MEKMSDIFRDISVRRKRKELKIGVIAGGISSEREISLATGREIYNSLLRSGYKAVFIDFKDEICSKLKKINLAFLALHGKYGEDGTVQGLLELLRVPYTGSGVLSSAMAMDKIISKKMFEYENIPIPEYIIVEKDDDIYISELNLKINEKFGYPVIVKPSREGSTIGVNIINNINELDSGVKKALNYDRRILVEEFIFGKLLTVSIIGEKPFALPIIEIKPKSGFYDYKSKYTSGLTDYIVPAPLEKKISEYIKELALKSHQKLRCSGISRVDLILDNNSNVYILELNTMPGMTPTSLVPKAAEAAGINFDFLVEIILNTADFKI